MSELEIPEIEEALDPTFLRRYLIPLLGEHVSVECTKLVRAKPGRRALLSIECVIGEAGNAKPVSLLGKIRRKGTDRKALRLHSLLRHAGLDGHGAEAVGVPRPYGCIEPLKMWVQQRVPGALLTDLLSTNSGELASQVTGGALAVLHLAGIVSEKSWSLDDELDVLRNALLEAETKVPQQGPIFRNIMEAVAQKCAALSMAPATGVHRDFYPDQVTIDGDNAWLLDLDLYCMSDPAIDLGNFLAHISEHAIRFHGEMDVLKRHERRFLEGYKEVRGEIDLYRVELMKIASLARHINISMKFPERRHTTAPLIAWLIETLDCCHGRRVPHR